MLQSNPQRPWEQEIRLSKLKTKSSANLNSKVIQFMGQNSNPKYGAEEFSQNWHKKSQKQKAWKKR